MLTPTFRISNRTDPYSKRKARVRVDVKLVAVLTSQGILVLESGGCEDVWVSLVFEDNVAVIWSAAVTRG